MRTFCVYRPDSELKRREFPVVAQKGKAFLFKAIGYFLGGVYPAQRAPIVQLDRASGFGPEGSRFES